MKKLKALALVLAVMMCMVGFAGCSNSGDEKKDSDAKTTESADATEEAVSEEIPEGGTFTVGFDASFPPYGYTADDGSYTGFDIELATEVAARRGWTIQLQAIDWDSKDFELSSRAIDCIWNGFTMNGREDEYTWSRAYVDNSQVFVVKSDSGIASPADLAGKNVVVQADSSAEAALNEEENAELTASFAQLLSVPEYNTAFLNLESGAVDAVAMDIGVAQYQIESRGEGYEILEEKLATEQYGIGFLLGNTALRDQVQETLDEMMADGKFMEIAEKYGLQDSVIMKEDADSNTAASSEESAEVTEAAQ